MANKPLISVIAPVYNVERYLPRCIESIIGQTLTDWELILVDDSSSDGSLSVCRSYAEKDDRIRAIPQEHGGASKARNTGVRLAEGEYLAFVDSDDYVSEDYLQKLYDSLTNADASISMCGLQCVDESGKSIPSPYIRDDVPEEISVHDAICMLGTNVAFGVLWNKLYKKEIFRSLQLPEGRTHEDEMVLHHLYGQCTSIATVTEKMYFYTIRSDSKMREKYGIEQLDILLAYIDRVGFLINNGFENEIIQYSHDNLMMYFKHSYLRGKRSPEYMEKLNGLRKEYIVKIYRRLPKGIEAPFIRVFTKAPFTYCILVTAKNRLHGIFGREDY